MAALPPVKLCSALCAALLALGAIAIAAPISTDDAEFFEKRIRPVLVAECYECHKSDKAKGGLALDSRDGVRKGGDSGEAIIPGKPDESLLIQSIRHEVEEDLKMPRKAPKLDERVIADFAEWVKGGAPDPRDKSDAALAEAGSWESLLASRRNWWSLEPVRKPDLPAVKNTAWSNHPVDRFILAKLEAANLAPAEPANPHVLIRRLSFALTGLPPTPEEVNAFVRTHHSPITNHQSPVAAVADLLLASPHFGERWARHWMDLVRYAETHGSEGDPPIPMAWRYRDYLIRAFNVDVPYDQLVREHLAGDLLPQPRLNEADGLNESALGIAHLRLVEHGFQPIDTLDDQVKVIENQIDVLGKAFQGLTLACARCHDHKFDAISQRDFYALHGVFASCRPAQVIVDAPARVATNREKLAALKPRIKSALADVWMQAAAAIGERLTSERDRSAEREKNAARARELEREISAIDWSARVRLGRENAAAPIAAWTFDGDARDSVGELHGKLEGGAEVRNGRLILDGNEAFARTEPIARDLNEKTFEAWVALANVEQRGGGVISLETLKTHGFDSLVFAEKEPGRWVPGSELFRRSRMVEGPAETRERELVHVAIVYGADRRVAVYRNGDPYGASYIAPDLKTFPARDARVLFGLRHKGAGKGFLTGEIEEARLYDRALTAEEIAASHKAGPAPALTPEQLTEALSPAQRERRTSLVAELASVKPALSRPSDDAWRAALRDAQNDPANPLHAWARLSAKGDEEFPRAWSELAQQIQSRAEEARRFNDEHFNRAWDLAGGDYERSWFRSGPGLPSRAASAGELAIEPAGVRVVGGLHAAGAVTRSLSEKHGGLLTSPRFKIETDSISVRATGGKGAMVRVIVDNYPLPSNPIFAKANLENDEPRWVHLDVAYRKGSTAYLEFGTVDSLTRPIAPRSKGKDIAPAGDGRSWFGAERVVFHKTAADDVPKEELLASMALVESGRQSSSDISVADLADCDRNVAATFLPPATGRELAEQYRRTLEQAIAAWREDRLTEPQRAFLDFFIRRGLLPVTLSDLEKAHPLIAEYRRLEAEIPATRHAPGVIETAGFDAPFYHRGEHTKPGDPVSRRYLEVFGSEPWKPALSGRLELAHELASAENPLTARVMVNRIWQHLFGRGLVGTVDNFGRLGDKPTHPELLDYLAARFVEEGWSVKKMIRLLVTSRTFQMSSRASEVAAKVDPANHLLQHMRVRRLDAEAIRDSMLAVSGQLDAKMFGPGEREVPRRSIYLSVRRAAGHPFLEIFDAPKPMTTRGQRDSTNLPAQSLAMMNSRFVIGLASAWAGELAKTEEPRDARIRRLFVRALAREPSSAELQDAMLFLDESADSARAWQDFAQAIFSLKEFIYLK